jgi:hypothetical protein
MQYGVSDGMPENMSEFVDYCEALEAATSREPPFPGTLAAFRAVCEEDPDAPLSRMKLSGLYHIRYDALGPRALPANFAVCGDAVMRLNPLFGQVRALDLSAALSFYSRRDYRGAHRPAYMQHALTSCFVLRARLRVKFP